MVLVTYYNVNNLKKKEFRILKIINSIIGYGAVHNINLIYL